MNCSVCWTSILACVLGSKYGLLCMFCIVNIVLHGFDAGLLFLHSACTAIDHDTFLADISFVIDHSSNIISTHMGAI